MKKALLVTTVSGFVPQFEMNNVKLLKEKGYEIHYAANYDMPVYGDNTRLEGTGIIRHQVDFIKSPFSVRNIKIYKQLKRIVDELNKDGELDIIHCHTPMGGALARLAARRYRRNGLKVIYTAHGFHFYKGGNAIKNAVFYSAEKWLSKITDVLITINKEDYEAGKKFHAKSCEYIPGIGIDLKKLAQACEEKGVVRKELGLSEDDYCLVSVGELSDRKNHKVVIEALQYIENKNIKYVICGSGANMDMLKELAERLKVSDRVIFAGYRTDAVRVMYGMDAFVFPSLQEGLPVALMEAMSVGLPIVASKIRGNRDLVSKDVGILVPDNDAKEYARAIEKIAGCSEAKLKHISEANIRILEDYTIEKVEKTMKAIYDNAEV